MVHSGVRECETRLPDLMSRRVAADIRGYAVSVRAFARARARALGRVICDVSGPIGCHLSSRCRRVPPLPPALPRFSPLSLSSAFLSFPLFSCPPLALPASNYLCRHPPMQPSDAIRSALLLSLPHPSSRESPLGLTHAIAPFPPYSTPATLFALSLAGIFSLLPHPPSLVSFSSLCQLPSSTLSRFISLFSAAMPMA